MSEIKKFIAVQDMNNPDRYTFLDAQNLKDIYAEAHGEVLATVEELEQFLRDEGIIIDNPPTSVSATPHTDPLSEPIRLTSESEIDQMMELHDQYKRKAQLLLEHFGIPYDPRSNPGQQLWPLVIAMAEKLFPGFKVQKRSRRPASTRRSFAGLKFYAVIHQAMKQTGWKLQDVLKALIEQDPETLRKYPTLNYPDYVAQYQRDNDEDKMRAEETLRRAYYEAQRFLKERLERLRQQGKMPILEELVDERLLFADESNWSPEHFEPVDLFEAYRQQVAFTGLERAENN